jgi:hypothetical protein
MIRGKKLRALAVVGDKAVELDGYGTIEPLTKTLPSFKAPRTTSASSFRRACLPK